MKIATVKFTDAEYAPIADLLRFKRVKSTSDAIRQGLMLLYASHKLKPESVKAIARSRQKHKPRRHPHPVLKLQ